MTRVVRLMRRELNEKEILQRCKKKKQGQTLHKPVTDGQNCRQSKPGHKNTRQGQNQHMKKPRQDITQTGTKSGYDKTQTGHFLDKPNLNAELFKIRENLKFLLVTLTLKQGGQQKKKQPHRLNDLPCRPLVLCSNLPNDHGYFNEVQLEFKTNFEKQKLLFHVKSSCVSACINFHA